MNKFLTVLVILSMAFVPMCFGSQMPDAYTEADFESDISGSVNFIVATEIDTAAELDALVATGNVIIEADIDTLAELDALVADKTIVDTTQIDTLAELDAIVADKTIVDTTQLDTFAEVDALVADKALVNKADGAVVLGVWDMGGATSLEIPNTVVGSLPAAGTVGRIAVVTDGSGATDCSTGAGSTVNMCFDNGANWVDIT